MHLYFYVQPLDHYIKYYGLISILEILSNLVMRNKCHITFFMYINGFFLGN